jgi:hypothetical protein
VTDVFSLRVDVKQLLRIVDQDHDSPFKLSLGAGLRF